MVRKSMRSGFSLIELIIVLIVSSVILSMIYETFFLLKKESVKSEAIYFMTKVKDDLENSLYDNNILLGTIIDEDLIRLRKKDPAGIVYSAEIYQKNIWNNLIKNSDVTKERNRITFLNGTNKSKYIIKILPKERTLVTSRNKIPYIDYWLLLIPREFYYVYKGDGSVSEFNEKITELVGINSTGVILFKSFQDYTTDFPLLSQRISESNFKKLRNDILLTKISSENIIRDKYLNTIERMNEIAKNIQDWSTIQMSMYENVISTYGGSYNISYFHSLGSSFSSSNINKNIIFSSSVFKNNSGLRSILSSSEGFNDIPLDNKYSTKYGFVLCASDCSLDSFYGNGDSSILIDIEGLETLISTENDAYLFDNNYGNIEVENAIPLSSNYIFPGSKLLMGVNENEKTSFGDMYDIYISNSNEITLNNGGTRELKLIQNVPKNQTGITVPSFGPYSLTFFTFFPWYNYGIDDGTREITFKDGIYSLKVFPELR